MSATSSPPAPPTSDPGSGAGAGETIQDIDPTLAIAGLLGGVITQNVDGLHQAGGAGDVVELHGGLDRTVCLGCGDVADRAALDERLRAVNPGFGPRIEEINPDGDAELPDDLLEAARARMWQPEYRPIRAV